MSLLMLRVRSLLLENQNLLYMLYILLFYKHYDTLYKHMWHVVLLL